MVQILPATGVPRRRGRFLDPKGAKEETVEPGLGDELEVEGWVGQVKRGAKRRVPVSTGVRAGAQVCAHDGKHAARAGLGAGLEWWEVRVDDQLRWCSPEPSQFV